MSHYNGVVRWTGGKTGCLKLNQEKASTLCVFLFVCMVDRCRQIWPSDGPAKTELSV